VLPQIIKEIGVVKLNLRLGTKEVFIGRVAERHCLGLRSTRSERSSIVHRIGTKYMCSFAVSHSMVLRFLKVDTLEFWCVASLWIETGML
jgi:hypothetical protein